MQPVIGAVLTVSELAATRLRLRSTNACPRSLSEAEGNLPPPPPHQYPTSRLGGGHSILCRGQHIDVAQHFGLVSLHPISVKEWCEHSPQAAAGRPPTSDAALTHLLNRDGFPEPCLLAPTPAGDKKAQRWRAQYADGLVREDVLEFSRIQEVGGMRVLLELLRSHIPQGLEA